jgi:hypothetical protein
VDWWFKLKMESHKHLIEGVRVHPEEDAAREPGPASLGMRSIEGRLSCLRLAGVRAGILLSNRDAGRLPGAADRMSALLLTTSRLIKPIMASTVQ